VGKALLAMIALSMYCFEHVVSPFKSKAESCLQETGQMAPTGDETKSVRRAIRFGLGKQKTAACPHLSHRPSHQQAADGLASTPPAQGTVWQMHLVGVVLVMHGESIPLRARFLATRRASGLCATAGVAVNICPLSAVKKQNFRCRPVN